MNDSFTKEQVLAAYNSAPDLIRATFNDEATTAIIMGLQARLQLHIDQAGTLGKEVGYLLLGLIDPGKFVSRLRSNNFQEQTINEIVADINKKIFIPLREKMRSVTNSAAPVPPIRQAVPQPRPAPMTVPVPKYASEQPKKYFHLENKIPTPPAPVTPRPMIAAAPANDEKLLEDHEEPHIDIKKEVPSNLPGIIHSEPQKPISPASPRPYSVDPYREPIDEK